MWVKSASQRHKISSWGRLGTILPLISKINRFSHFRYYSNICGFKKKYKNQPVAEPLGPQCHCNARFKPKWKSLKVRRFQEAPIKVRGDYSGTIEVKEKVTVTDLMTNLWFIHLLKQLGEKLGKYVKGQVGKSLASHTRLWPQQLSPHKGGAAMWGGRRIPGVLLPWCLNATQSWGESQEFGFTAALAGTNIFYQGAESSPCCRIGALVPPHWANQALLEQGFMENCLGNEEKQGGRTSCLHPSSEAEDCLWRWTLI